LPGMREGDVFGHEFMGESSLDRRGGHRCPHRGPRRGAIVHRMQLLLVLRQRASTRAAIPRTCTSRRSKRPTVRRPDRAARVSERCGMGAA
jgi:hypothetical protein